MDDDASAIGMTLASFALTAALMVELGGLGVFGQAEAKATMATARKLLRKVKFTSPAAREAAKTSLEYFEGLALLMMEKQASGRPQ